MGPKIRISFKLSVYKVEIGKLEQNSESFSHFIRRAVAAPVSATHYSYTSVLKLIVLTHIQLTAPTF